MTPERFARIEAVYHAVLEQEPGTQERYLAEVCRDDDELRRNVQALLVHDRSPGLFGQSPLEMAAVLMSDAPAQKLAAGAQLGPYRIERLLGRGGMGEVYKARDERLGRSVAIKVAHERFSSRFEREAKAISALNHPHICTLYDVGALLDGDTFLVMEYVEGETLTERLRRGPLPANLIFQWGAQIAQALKAAHDRGLIHRDLKAANIMLTEAGVKVLDFGLAKFVASEELDETVSASHTIVGTAAYMSPEQARGAGLDGRSDLWSVGVILYQTATGSLPFPGETTAVIFDAIFNQAPPPARLRNPAVSAELERIIGKLLEKDRDLRYQSASDLAADLKRMERDSSSASSRSPVERKSRRALPFALAAFVSILVAAGGAWWWRHSHRAPLTDQDIVVVGDFTNSTGDNTFDGILRQALALQLERSPFLKTLSDVQMRQDFRLSGHPPGERITNDLARRSCVQEGDKAMISGAIARLGATYPITLEASNCETGEVLARAQGQADSKEHILKAVEEATLGIRQKLGETLASIPKRPSYDVTTTSFDAFEQLSKGIDQFNQGRYFQSIPLLERATQLDPKFATAWLFLATAYGWVGSPGGRMIEDYKKAYALREGGSESEQFYIPGFYFLFVTGELEKALDICGAWARAYPRLSLPRLMTGRLYVALGQLDQALSEFVEADRIDPRVAGIQGWLAFNYYALNRRSEAQAVAQRSLAQNPDDADMREEVLNMAYAAGDDRAAESQMQWFSGRPEEFMGLEEQGWAAITRGQRLKAQELLRKAGDLRSRRNLTPVGGISDQDEALIGNCKAARKSASPGAIALVLCFDTAQVATSLAATEDAAKREPNRTQLNALLLPLMRAMLELKRDRPMQAIALLNSIGSFERVFPPVAYIRGLAFLKAGKGADAEVEFQKILDGKAVFPPVPPYSYTINSVSYVDLARAAAMAGDVPKARKAYADFLALWKNADPDLPILMQARKELAELR
jgi:eukaryotic-like serine/threonine-protein kinase